MKRWTHLIYGMLLAAVGTVANCSSIMAAEQDVADDVSPVDIPDDAVLPVESPAEIDSSERLSTDTMFVWKSGDEYLRYTIDESLVLTFPGSTNVRFEHGRSVVVIPLNECADLSISMRRIQRQINTSISRLQHDNGDKSVMAARHATRKLFRGNRIVIERDGEAYNVSGLRVKGN